MSNSINLIKDEKERIENEICNLYFPPEVYNNLEAEAEKVWNNHIKSLYPDVDESKFFKIDLTVNYKERYILDINGIYIRTACINLCNRNIEASLCTFPHFKEIVKMYRDLELQETRFRELLRTQLCGIRNVTQFKERLPQFVQFITGYENYSDLAVPLDLSNIEGGVIAV